SMESSQIIGNAEECHSSESGWTMYIGSPIRSYEHDEDDDDDNDNTDDNDDSDDYCVKPEDDSDDSMASDASSGRSHRASSSEKRKSGHGMAQHKPEVGKEFKKVKCPVEENGHGKRRHDQEEKEAYSVSSEKGGNQVDASHRVVKG
ncbi:hypothetical protein U1Q18_005133, partial [Sarracenia purpurea var. burkii]